MRYLKFKDKDQLFAWTDILAKRSDMIEINTEDVQSRILDLPIVDKPREVAIPEPPNGETPEPPNGETPAPFTMKRGAFGRYDVLDRLGNIIAKSLPQDSAQAKIEELSA